VDFEVALQRAVLRDLPIFGSPQAIQARYVQRYFPGQRIYLQHVRPKERANLVMENNDPAHPILKELST
jgi:uridine kinase